MRLYVNGDLVATNSNAIRSVPANTARVLLGARPLENGMVGDGRFTGAIDEVAVYDRALSDAEIKAHFQAK